tara:strand:+ start:2525 stop:3112 length:588 start_codon:yes stop_codon:yes gene_type:complete
MATFYDLAALFDQIGGFDILLPFILVFSILFAILRKMQIFGAAKNVDVIVSLVLALFFLRNEYLIFTMQRFLPNVSIMLVIFVAFFLLIGIFAPSPNFGNKATGLAFLVALVALAFALFSDVFYPVPGGFYGTGLAGIYYSIDPGTRFMMWILLFAAAFVYFIVKEPGTPGAGKLKKQAGDLLENLGKGWKGSGG